MYKSNFSSSVYCSIIEKEMFLQWHLHNQNTVQINLLARLHEVHRAIVVTSVVRVYVYVCVRFRVRVTLSVKVFYKSISLDHVDGSS